MTSPSYTRRTSSEWGICSNHRSPHVLPKSCRRSGGLAWVLVGAIATPMDERRYELATFSAANRLRLLHCSLAHGHALAPQVPRAFGSGGSRRGPGFSRLGRRRHPDRAVRRQGRRRRQHHHRSRHRRPSNGRSQRAGHPRRRSRCCRPLLLLQGPRRHRNPGRLDLQRDGTGASGGTDGGVVPSPKISTILCEWPVPDLFLSHLVRTLG